MRDCELCDATMEDLAKAKAAEKHRKELRVAAAVMQKEVRDREEYARLKAKFEKI